MVSSGYDTTIGFCAVSAGCVNLQCLLAVFLGWGEKKNQDEPLGRGTPHALGAGPMDTKLSFAVPNLSIYKTCVRRDIIKSKLNITC